MGQKTDPNRPWLSQADRFEVGDKVTRPISDDPKREGVVVRRYHPSEQRGAVRQDWILYSIRWDDQPDVVSHGHMGDYLELASFFRERGIKLRQEVAR